MPELPEVETVKRQLEKEIIGLTFSKPQAFTLSIIKTPLDEFEKELSGKKITSLSRKGKFLIIHLTENKKLIFHLRMEGKLFYYKEKIDFNKHLVVLFPFNDGSYLAFYDTRKFGCCYFLNEDDIGPINIGKEPFSFTEDEFYHLLHIENKYLKELLLDQKLIAGIGNIYSDEICFKSGISPFKYTKNITKEEASLILKNSIEILNSAIENNGSTVKSYKASKHVSGSFQNKLNVYSKAHTLCNKCKKVKIEKRRLNGRGTSLCPICQKAGINVAITGKIASGKSLVASYFNDFGFALFSCDDEVHKLYKDNKFLESLENKFPMIFTPKFNKKKITTLLTNDKKFKKEYETYIFDAIKKKINEFIILNDGKDKVFEVPLLFDAHMENMFTYIVGVETDKQLEHLKERGEDASRANFNKLNSYDLNKDKLDFVIKTNSTKEELKIKVRELCLELKSIT